MSPPARTFPSLANSAAAATADDAITFDTPSAIYVGVSGDIVVDCAGQGSQVKFPNFPVGFLPVWCTKVWNAGTTASGLVRVWG